MKTLINCEIYHPDFIDSQKIWLDWDFIIDKSEKDVNCRIEIKNDGIDYIKTTQIKEDDYKEENLWLQIDDYIIEFDSYCDNWLFGFCPKCATWDKNILTVSF